MASASAKALDLKGGSPFQANVTGLNPTEVTASSREGVGSNLRRTTSP